MQEVGGDGTSIFDILFCFSYKKYFFTRQTLDCFEIIGTFGTLSTRHHIQAPPTWPHLLLPSSPCSHHEIMGELDNFRLKVPK